MQRNVIRAWAAMAVLVTFTGAYLAAQNPNPNPPAPPLPPAGNPQPNPPPNDPNAPQPGYERRSDATTAQQAPMARRAKQVLGSKVSLQGNVSIGTVDDIIFSDDGYIDYLVVINEGKYVIVPWQAAKFNFENRSATLAIDQTRFREVPTYTTQTYPTVNFYEPAYVTRIYGYYGIQPRNNVERRIDRREDRRERNR